MSAEYTRRIDITEPQKPFEFPLRSGQMGKLLGVSKETLYRWERDGKINRIPQPLTLKGSMPQRAYGPEQLMDILRHMKTIEVTGWGTRYKWLKDADLEGEFRVSTPDGYTIGSDILQTD